VGTNSVKFHVGEDEVTRLGEGLAAIGGEFSPGAMERTAAAIRRMAAEAKEMGAVAIAAVGTMGMRTARNSEAFIEEVMRRSGVRIEVISGQRKVAWPISP
jgi:exopolyphosphatase / guanosine-5'-triphosphate,3'-diphosphate pyrophosphatase